MGGRGTARGKGTPPTACLEPLRLGVTLLLQLRAQRACLRALSFKTTQYQVHETVLRAGCPFRAPSNQSKRKPLLHALPQRALPAACVLRALGRLRRAGAPARR